MGLLRRIAKKYFSKKIINLFRNNINIFKVNSTRKFFKNAQSFPNFLEKSDLEELQKKYPFPPEYGYDEKSLETRGIKRLLKS